MMKSKFLLASGVLGFIGLMGVAEGQMVITQEVLAPTGNVVASNNPTDTSAFTNAALYYTSDTSLHGKRIWGQSFYNEVGGEIIDTITLKFWNPGTYTASVPINTGTPRAEILMQIFEMPDASTKSVNFENPLVSWTGDLPSDLAVTSIEDPQFLVFDVPNEFVMEADTYYAFVYQFTEQASNRQVHFAYLGGGSAYTEGRVIYYNLVDGVMVEQNSNTDLAFVITTIPEPASLGLLGMAGLFFLYRRK